MRGCEQLVQVMSALTTSVLAESCRRPEELARTAITSERLRMRSTTGRILASGGSMIWTYNIIFDTDISASFLCSNSRIITHIRLWTSRFREHGHISRFHDFDAHVVSHFDSAPHLGCAKNFEAQNGKIILLGEFHDDLISSGVLRRR